jgi:hypothetical protein
VVLARDRSSAPLGRDADARHWHGSNSAFSRGDCPMVADHEGVRHGGQ